MGNSTKKTNAITPKIKSLKIENFRGIKKFELNDLGKINIFLGRNSVSKTSILEAIWLNTGMRSVNNIQAIDTFRNIHYKNIDDYLLTFNNLNPENHPEIILNIEGQNRKAVIKPLYDFPTPMNSTQNGNGIENIKKISYPELSNKKAIRGYELCFEVDGQKYSSKLLLDNQHVPSSPSYKEIYYSYMFTPHLRSILGIQEMVTDEKEQELIESMKKIDNRITSIAEVNGEFLVGIDIGKRIPLKLLGEGLISIISIQATLYHMRNQFLLIDEIDNGLHYKSQELVWEIITEQSFNNNIDCFITSHSKEMLETLSRFLAKEENEKYQNLFKFYTLFKNKNNYLDTSIYNYNEFAEEIEYNGEMRGFF